MPTLSDAREGVRDSVPAGLQAVADATCASVSGLLAMIRRIDNALMFIDRTLRVSQPPIARKLGVRFWVTTRGAPREPVLVTWRRINTRRWRARRVRRLSRLQVNSAGQAALCADNTFRLATTAVGLIRLRTELVRSLRLLRNSAVRARGRYPLIDRAEAIAIAEHADVVKRLASAGYGVDERTKSLADQFLA